MPRPEYILDTGAEEIRRLQIQSDAMAKEAAIMLDRIGIQQGWHCVELGCGTGGIMDQLSARVGPRGRVLGLDQDKRNLEVARNSLATRENVEFLHAGILDNVLPDGSFDFVHIRFVLTIVGQNEDIIAAAARLVKPGGVLALEEGDGSGINCHPPNDAFIELRKSLFTVFGEVGDPMAGRHMFAQLRNAGFEDVNFRPCRAGARSTDDMAMYLPETVRSVRQALLQRKIFTERELEEKLAECEAHLRHPDTISTHIGVFQVWGRKPV